MPIHVATSGWLLSSFTECYFVTLLAARVFQCKQCTVVQKRLKNIAVFVIYSITPDRRMCRLVIKVFHYNTLPGLGLG